MSAEIGLDTGIAAALVLVALTALAEQLNLVVGRRTRVSLSQDNNENDQAREHSEQNWKTMLEGLKKLLEK